MRVEIGHADDGLGKRIRNAKMEKIPYVLVVGDDDVAARTVGVNPRGGEVVRGVPMTQFVADLRAEVADAELVALRAEPPARIWTDDSNALWSGWRSAYVAGEAVDTRAAFDRGAGAASVFTQLLESGLSDDETHIVHRGPTVLRDHEHVPVHQRPPARAAVPGGPRPARLSTPTETAELWATVTDAVTAVREAFRPDGVNVGLNLGRASGGSVPTHLHVHVVPRWTGDTNFMASIANTQTIPESLAVSARKVRAAWPDRP